MSEFLWLLPFFSQCTSKCRLQSAFIAASTQTGNHALLTHTYFTDISCYTVHHLTPYIPLFLFPFPSYPLICHIGSHNFTKKRKELKCLLIACRNDFCLCSSTNFGCCHVQWMITSITDQSVLLDGAVLSLRLSLYGIEIENKINSYTITFKL